VDSNHAEIADALRGVGASVQSLAPVGRGVPDLLCWFRGELHLLEVKSGPREPLTPDEVNWHVRWRGHVHVVRSVEEALRAVGAIHATQEG
jgi:hypothetical protein